MLNRSVLRKEQIVVLLGLVIIVALSWQYLFSLGAVMPSMADMAMPQTSIWNISNVISIATMWIIMMIAMMIPSAAPMVLLFANVNKKRSAQHKPFVPTWIFTSGYILVWSVFAAAAAIAQLALNTMNLASPGGVLLSSLVSGPVLIVAGIYQFTPIKHACLKKCQEPFSFFSSSWRDGKLGALEMGIKHGAYCLGCCWFLMAILFVVGVMNLLWVALIAVFALMEKIIPGKLLSWISGLFFMVWGAWLIFR